MYSHNFQTGGTMDREYIDWLKRIISDTNMKKLLSEIESDIVKSIVTSNPSMQDERERLYQELRGVRRIEAKIKTTIAKHKQAMTCKE